MNPPKIGGGQLQGEITRALQEAMAAGAGGGPHGHPIAEVTGLQAVLDAKSEFSGSYNDLTDKPAIPATKSDVGLGNVDNTSDAAKPISTATQAALDGKAATGHNHDATYEPKNANVQAHVIAAHAPSNAQKNSDITKAEIEAVLTGEIGSHTHAGGAGGSPPMLCVPLVADAAGLALTNMALALGFLGGSHRFATKVDLTNFTQVRLVVNKQGVAGAAASKVLLRYRTAFDATPANGVGSTTGTWRQFMRYRPLADGVTVT